MKWCILLTLHISTVCFGQVQPGNSINENLKIARSYIADSKEKEAILYLNAVLSANPAHEEALSLRAKTYYNLKIFDKALVDYNGLIVLKPQNTEVLYARGTTRYQLGQFILAIEDFTQVLESPPEETQTAFFNIDSGTNTATGVTTIQTMKPDILNFIGLCYYKLGNYHQAIASFSEGIDMNDKKAGLYVNRGLAYEKAEDLKRALKDYERALSVNPDHEIAGYNALKLKLDQDHNLDVLESLNAFVIENPTVAEGYASRGWYYFETQKYDLAHRDYAKATHMDPESIDFKFNLALCQEKLGKFDEAETIFHEIISVDPVHSGAYFNLGNLKYKQARYTEAISYYTLAHHYNSKNTSVLYNRALAYFNNDQLEKACADMKTVMEVDEELAKKFYSKYCNHLE